MKREKTTDEKTEFGVNVIVIMMITVFLAADLLYNWAVYDDWTCLFADCVKTITKVVKP